MIGSNIKFSAFAILPSKAGKPNKIAKTNVVKKVKFLFASFLKSFFDNKKNVVTENAPNISEISLMVN